MSLNFLGATPATREDIAEIERALEALAATGELAALVVGRPPPPLLGFHGIGVDWGAVARGAGGALVETAKIMRGDAGGGDGGDAAAAAAKALAEQQKAQEESDRRQRTILVAIGATILVFAAGILVAVLRRRPA